MEKVGVMPPSTMTESDMELEINNLRTFLGELRNRQPNAPAKHSPELLGEFGRQVSKGSQESIKSKCTSKESNVSLAPGVTPVEQVLAEASDSEASIGSEREPQEGYNHSHYNRGLSLQPGTNIRVMLGSALAKGRIMQAFIYLLAFGGVVFVLVAKATKLGVDNSQGHRLLLPAPSVQSSNASDGASDGAALLLVQVAFCVASAGLLAFLVNIVNLPLILGYLLAGVLVGPIGLDIVHSQADITDMSSLGLIFLLFMIGLELDVSEILKMGKVVITTGLLQFPLCAGIMTGIFVLLQSMGLSWGSGQYAALYVGMPCGISSTMVVVKLLAEHAETDSAPGRLTIGILIFQDIWAIIVLAIQPNMANPEVLGLLKTFAMIAVLVLVGMFYAKFVMPAVFLFTSKSIELMLITALAWCFFMCCLATLPFVGLSMELASLMAGVALATFPYSAEFNGKIKYIRDFFITLFFVGLGMQIPVPTIGAVAKGVLVAIVVMAFRWLGIFLVVKLAGGESKLAAVATINLSQISEFALVICSLGITFEHIDAETLTIVIWTFAMLGISSSYMIGNNYAIYGFLSNGCRKLTGRHGTPGDGQVVHDVQDGHPDRNIIILGFHKVAAMLIAHFEHHSPHLLAKLHIIDFHEHIMPELRKRGVTCAYGDISSTDVLEHAHHGEARLVICSIPNSMLRGVTNLRLLQISKQVWPTAHVIVTADRPEEAELLYDQGAEYVLRVSKLCAERLEELIHEHSTHAVHRHHVGQESKLNHVLNMYREKDTEDYLKDVVF